MPYWSRYDDANTDRLIGGLGDWFGAKLVRLYAKADFDNRRRLARSFPRMARSFEAWYHGGNAPKRCRCTRGYEPVAHGPPSLAAPSQGEAS